MTLQEKLVALRKKRGLSQTNLAVLLAVLLGMRILEDKDEDIVSMDDMVGEEVPIDILSEDELRLDW